VIPPNATDEEIRHADRDIHDRICVDGSKIRLPQFDEEGNFWD
jgi:hypothetical protein